ncbi:polysaccharide lyase family protein [Saccharicrinis sp. FJH54]|uniref:polysaccharide lyase family protein n=1 Tax=Saccharicrinis sp. FJH54 TaxID=3344665 RepID=UPI0035D43102
MHQKIFIPFILLFFRLSLISAQPTVTATISESSRTATMSNGTVSLSINSKGQVSSITLNGHEFVSNGGKFYFSYNDQDAYYELNPDGIRIQKQTDDYAEVVYSNTTGNIKVEQGFILKSGVNGLYSYVIVRGTSKTTRLREMRVVYRVDPNQFDYGYVDDSMQGYLPSVDVMKAVDGNAIMDATYPLPDGSIYTKYNWANYIVRDSVHGIMSDAYGLWAIPVSTEYMNGGPMKQELTVHTTTKTPLVLQMLQGEHFGASAQTYETGDEKIYGPFFIYLNSGDSHEGMVADARSQVAVQKAQWPFSWLENDLYPLNRCTVNGRIKVPWGVSAKGIQVVLAQPGSDIYEQGMDYMFWDKTDASGNFSIKNVRSGEYSVYAYATLGDVTDEYYLWKVRLSGSTVNLGELDWDTEKRENLLWTIGENDRLSDGYKYSDTIRQYGLYELPPANLTYTIGSSTPDKNWYYAQTKEGNWDIKFNLDRTYSGTAYLTASVAGAANNPEIDVYINGSRKETWTFSNDASIYRSAVLGGKHTVRTLTFPASNLHTGSNTIRLKMSNVGNRGGVMYDCIKLETGGLITSVQNPDIENPDKLACISNVQTGQVKIAYYAKETEHIKINIFDLKGTCVKSIYQGPVVNGKHIFTWSDDKKQPGIYICTVVTGDKTFTKKLIITK